MRSSAAMKPAPALKAAPRPSSRQTAAISQTREVMDIRQAADYLGLSPDTLYKYASEGFVPAFKFGNRWRFKKSRLDDWMDHQSDASMANPEVASMPTVRQKKPSRPAR